jgi:signal peptidase I
MMQARKMTENLCDLGSWHLVVCVFACLLVSTTGCQKISGYKAYIVPSSSMEKTIYKGDTILCDMRAYKTHLPERGDVVVFQHGNTILAKRLIGLPGDRVEGRDGVVVVNGNALDEPYAEHIGPEVFAPGTFGPTTVAANEVFLLGDNRDNSLDSRLAEFGRVSLSDIRGKATSIARTEHGQAGRTIK